MGKFRQCLTELSASDTIMTGYFSLTFLLLSVVKQLVSNWRTFELVVIEIYSGEDFESLVKNASSILSVVFVDFSSRTLSPLKKFVPHNARPVTPKDIFLYHSKRSKNNLGPGISYWSSTRENVQSHTVFEPALDKTYNKTYKDSDQPDVHPVWQGFYFIPLWIAWRL